MAAEEASPARAMESNTWSEMFSGQESIPTTIGQPKAFKPRRFFWVSVLENTPKEDVLTALFLGVLGLFTHPAIAQDGEGASEEEVAESEAPYVPSFLGNRPGKGAFFAPSTRVTGFGSQGAITVGGRAGWIYHHSLSLGVEGHILASPTVWHPEAKSCSP